MSLESRFRHILATFGQPVPTAGEGMICRPCVPIPDGSAPTSSTDYPRGFEMGVPTCSIGGR
jgi:hypothetical protein